MIRTIILIGLCMLMVGCIDVGQDFKCTLSYCNQTCLNNDLGFGGTSINGDCDCYTESGEVIEKKVLNSCKQRDVKDNDK